MTKSKKRIVFNFEWLTALDETTLNRLFASIQSSLAATLSRTIQDFVGGEVSPKHSELSLNDQQE